MSNNQEQYKFHKMRPHVIKNPNEQIVYQKEAQQTNQINQQQNNNFQNPMINIPSQGVQIQNNNYEIPQNVVENPTINIPNYNLAEIQQNNSNPQLSIMLSKQEDLHMPGNDKNSNQFPVTAQSIVIPKEGEEKMQVLEEKIISQSVEESGQNNNNQNFFENASSQNEGNQSIPQFAFENSNQNFNLNNDGLNNNMISGNNGNVMPSHDNMINLQNNLNNNNEGINPSDMNSKMMNKHIKEENQYKKVNKGDINMANNMNNNLDNNMLNNITSNTINMNNNMGNNLNHNINNNMNNQILSNDFNYGMGNNLQNIDNYQQPNLMNTKYKKLNPSNNNAVEEIPKTDKKDENSLNFSVFDQNNFETINKGNDKSQPIIDNSKNQNSNNVMVIDDNQFNNNNQFNNFQQLNKIENSNDNQNSNNVMVTDDNQFNNNNQFNNFQQLNKIENSNNNQNPNNVMVTDDNQFNNNNKFNNFQQLNKIENSNNDQNSDNVMVTDDNQFNNNNQFNNFQQLNKIENSNNNQYKDISKLPNSNMYNINNNQQENNVFQKNNQNNIFSGNNIIQNNPNNDNFESNNINQGITNNNQNISSKNKKKQNISNNNNQIISNKHNINKNISNNNNNKFMNILNNNNKNQNISNNNDINQDILNNNINQNIPNNNNFINILNNNNQNISNNNNNIPNFSNNNNNQEIINNDNNQNLFNNNMNQNIPNNNNFMMKNNNINQNIQKNNNFFHNNQKNNAIQNIPGDNNQKNIQGNLNINNKKNNNLLAPAVPANTKYSFSRYTKAPLTGLINMGDTSYLNATLQIIGNLRNFASYFVNPINVMYIQNNYQTIPLSFVFQRLFYHLYPYPEKHDREKYKPEYVKNVIARKNKIYATNKRRNPNELISFILNNLHFELNKNKGSNQQFNINNNNKDNVIMYGCQNYLNKNNSAIFNLLNWFEIKEKKCSQCNNSTFHLNTFNIFELDILGAYSYRKNPITINDCLDLYSFLRQQTLFCITCRKYTKILNKSQIYSSPNTFIFSLDRKNLDQNYMNIPFNLTEKLNLNNYIENKDSPTNYQLIGVLSFYVNENKYISFCLSPVDKMWYVYNDEKVEPTNINSIIQLHNFGKKFIPCLLVYKSVTQNS